MDKRSNSVKWWLAVGLTPVAVVIHGFVLAKLWSWFMVTTFSVPTISVVEAAGLMLVVDFILLKIDWDDYATKASLDDFITKWISHTLVTPFVIMAIGYILTLFL